MKKVLVTGGMGFVGGHLVNELLNQGCDVTVLDKSIYKPVPFAKSQVKIIEADILARNIVKDCLQQVDTCFHLAALSSLPICNADWIFSHKNNVMGFNTILDVLTEIDYPVKLVYASSSAVYGNSTELPLNENARAQPISPYGGDKLTNEICATFLAANYHIPSIGLRLFNVYGLGQMESNPYSGVITLFKRQIVNKQTITIYGDGEQTRDFIFVQDVVKAFIRAAKTPETLTGIYNVCNGKAITINELAFLMMKIYNITVPIEYAPPRVGDLLHSLGNPELAAKTFDFIGHISMEEGLKTMIS